MALAVVFTGCQGSDPDEPEKPKDVNVTGISLDRTGISMVEGETTTLTATVTPSNATDKSITWTSNAPEVAGVNDNGKVNAIKAGEATITVTTEDGGKTATCKVKVTGVLATSISVPARAIPVGGKTTLTATVLPESANDKSVTWSSEDAAIATVDPATGEVTGIAIGIVKITATANDGSGVSGSGTVTVISKVKSVSINPSSTTMKKGNSTTLVATVTPVDGVTIDTGVTWSSSDESIATVDAGGKVTGLAVGTVTITAISKEDSSKKATCTVKVSEDGSAIDDYGGYEEEIW